MTAESFADWVCDNLRLPEFVRVWNEMGVAQGALIASWSTFEAALRHDRALSEPYDEAHALAEARGFGPAFRGHLHRRLDPVIVGSSMLGFLDVGSDWAARIAGQDPATHPDAPFATPEAWAEWALAHFAAPGALRGDGYEAPMDRISTLHFMAQMLAAEVPRAIEAGWIAVPAARG